jgi:hypothetical protein
MNLMDRRVEMGWMDGKVFRRVSSAELQKFNFWSLVFKSTVQHQQTDGKSRLRTETSNRSNHYRKWFTTSNSKTL